MISKQIIIIFMNTNLKGILERRASKKDNLKTQRFQIPMLFLKCVDLLLKNIPSGACCPACLVLMKALIGKKHEFKVTIIPLP
jgi:hypothetical protein